MNLKILFFLLSLVVSAIGYSQPGFRGSAIVGLNLAQLDGDNIIGYNKAGITTGLKVSFNLNDKLDGNVELLYSQRGSSLKLFKTDTAVVLSYIELPFYISYKDWYVEEGKYYRMLGHLGLSVGGLASKSVRGFSRFTDEDFSDRDLSFLVGATYYFTEHVGFTARYTRSLNKLLKDDSLDPTGYLLSYFWSLRAEYKF